MDSFQLNIWAVFYAAVAIQGFVVTGILLTTQKGNPRANKYLAFLILAFSCTRLQSFSSMAGLYEQLPHAIFLATPFWYILAPLFFFYVKNLLDQSARTNLRSLLHFLPFMAVIIFLLPFYTLSAETKYFFWSQSFNANFGLRRFLFALLYDLQNFVYLAASLTLVRKHEKLESRPPVSANLAHVKWLRFLLTLIAAYIVLDLLVITLNYATGIQLLEMKYLPMAIFSILIYSISFLAIQEPARLFPRYLSSRRRKAVPENGQEIHKQLLAMMEEQKLYRNNNLRYSDIAAKLKISVSQLSKIMNNEIGKSFNDFVNSYRVQDAKERLSQNESDKHTLLALAFDAGFNSKPSFNRIFKRHTGLTPSEYVKRHNENSA